MDNEKTGGPAFPRKGHRVQPAGKIYTETIEAQDGMLLLDHFAGLAMHAWWSGGDGCTYPGPMLEDAEEHERQVEAWRNQIRKDSAKWSYDMAAAMITERKRIMESE
jgi:hypothetical protein